MLKGLRAAAHFFNQKIGFSRLGVVLSITIITIAAIVLYHILRDIDLDELVDALEATDWRTLLIAGLFVAAAYLTLTFYDLFALRTIGRYEVPYRSAALGSFTSYAVGHNVGASVFSGGAVRYRIYSAWGLSVIEVTKICFVAGLTFWLGNAAMLGLGVFYAPQQASDIDHLPIWLNRIVAILILMLLAAYIAWVWVKPRVVGRDGWKVSLPGGPLTLGSDRDRHPRSVVLRDGHVHAGARRAASRLYSGGRHLRYRNAVGVCQSRSRRSRRVRRDDDGGTVGVRQGRPARRAVAVSPAVLHHPVRALAVDPRNARGPARPRGAGRCATVGDAGECSQRVGARKIRHGLIRARNRRG
jgi:uncharacterized membrane protein YbhN (UPF0104 family)